MPLLFIQLAVASITHLAQQLAGTLVPTGFALTTEDGYNMDCLKAILLLQPVGVFHSSKGQSQYNGLHLAEKTSQGWQRITKLSERGSQGYIHSVTGTSYLLVLYELQNSKGNTLAIRFYEDLQRLRANNFLYEYQLSRIVQGKNVVNVGTPSVDGIECVSLSADPTHSIYRLDIRYHYSPDGSNDYPGIGSVILDPHRDFVDSKGNWVGGCKENYSWTSRRDTAALAAIRKAGFQGKIGQRDRFQLQGQPYYLYEANLNEKFDWHNWRIVLYSETEGAVPVSLNLSGTLDFANPHISRAEVNQSSSIFWVSFFLPSEGVAPGVRAGQFTGTARLSTSRPAQN